MKGEATLVAQAGATETLIVVFCSNPRMAGAAG